MIRGTVDGTRTARVRLRVRDALGPPVELEFVIDTGYNGQVTLPQHVVQTLGLPQVHTIQSVLADGRVVLSPVHHVEIEWSGGWQIASVTAIGTEPLIGMELLADHELWMEVAPGGHVEIRAIP